METLPLSCIEYIDTPHDLSRFCAHLAESDWIAIDTEFMRERTYAPILCLLQIATARRVACIDTLALTDLHALQPIFSEAGPLKILHSGRQDIEVLRSLWDESPSPVFDTQIAAALTGLPDQIGYAALVDTLFNVKLGKHHTRTDWSHRPLSPEQIRYAAEDVLYLGEAYRTLSANLNHLDRMGWMEEECTALLNPSLYQNTPNEAWRRLRAAPYLPPNARVVLQALAAWRETTAQTRNLPRTWLLKDDQICMLAQLDPSRLDPQGPLPGLDHPTQKRHGKVLLSLIKAVHATLPPTDPLALPLRAPQLTPEQKSLLKHMTSTVQSLALQVGVPPTLLASRKDLEALLLDDTRPSRLEHGWRKSVLGTTLLTILDRPTPPDITDPASLPEE